jgi:predicted RNase H-like HicB family nuclease
MKVLVRIYPSESGGYWAQVPAIPGCITEGETREELLANLREALEGCLLTPRGDFEPEAGGESEEVEL